MIIATSHWQNHTDRLLGGGGKQATLTLLGGRSPNCLPLDPPVVPMGSDSQEMSKVSCIGVALEDVAIHLDSISHVVLRFLQLIVPDQHVVHVSPLLECLPSRTPA